MTQCPELEEDDCHPLAPFGARLFRSSLSFQVCPSPFLIQCTIQLIKYSFLQIAG